MAGYDASIRVNTKVDNSDLKKIHDDFIEMEKQFGNLSDVAEDYETRLKQLRNKGFGPGNKEFDELYIAWKNSVNAEKEYLANLDKMTDKGMAEEAARIAREQEKQAEAQRKIEEQAEKNLQKENARLEKESQIDAKLREEAAEQERLKSIKDSAVVSDEQMVQLLQRQAELKTYLNDLGKAGVTAGYAQYDNATNELQKISAQITERRKLSKVLNDNVSGFERLLISGKKFFKSVQSGAKKSNGLFSTMKSRLKGIALSLLVFNWITKGFNAMVSAMKEGFKNLSKYSSDYNNSMSALKSQTAQLKNGLAAAFEPIANTVIPYLTQMVAWMNRAADAVSQFLAALQGKSTYTKAKKQVIDYAKSLDTASESAKGALASFDDLNVYNKSESGSAGGEATGASAFETGTVEADMISLADRVQEILQPFKDSIANWFQGLDFSPLLDALGNLKSACEPFVSYIYDGMLWLLENVLEPLGSWTMEDALPSFISMLSDGMNTLNNVLETLRPTFDYIWQNILVPIGNYTGEVFLWAIDLIKDAFSSMSQLFSEKGDKINEILTTIGRAIELLWKCVAKPTIDLIRGALKTFLQYVVNIVGDLIDAFSGIIDFLTGVFTGNWKKAWNGLVDVFKGIINLFIDIFEGVVNTIIDGLNFISVDVPDWVPGIGGKHFGFDLEKLDLPRLAEGMVIQGGSPFAAILGDQRYGQTNIETPLPTMVDAFKQAISDMGGLNKGYSGPLYLQIDGKTFAKLELPYLNGEQNRIGVSFNVT